MKATYKLQLEQHQRRLGLTHKELNRYDRKHNDINLIKYLQSLEQKVLASAGKTGFWGTFLVENEKGAGSQPRYMTVYLAYNDIALTPSQEIDGDTDYTFNISEADRLPLPSSILQLKITMQSLTQSVNLDDYDGFETQDLTNNPLDEENTLTMLVDASNYDNGQCSILFIVHYEVP